MNQEERWEEISMRTKALELACEGAAAKAAVSTIIEIATDYYNFLKGATNE